MTKYVLIFLHLFVLEAQSQDSTTANRIYFKLCILNENNEILLVEHNNNWELIGGEYNTTKTMEEYVSELAMTSDVEVTHIRLRGLFSVYFGKMSKPFAYHYYSARFKSGKIKPPDNCTGVQWVGLDEAKKIMAYREMAWMCENIIENNQLWGGAYRIVKDPQKGTRKVESIVDYFNLN